MKSIVRLAALLMEQTSYFQKFWIETEFEKTFPDSGNDDFKSAWRSFEGDGSLVGFDLEHDGLNGAVFEHETHGTINMDDLVLFAGDETYYGLGAAFSVRLYEMKSAVAEVAVDAGLSEAARIIAQLPIDSSAWTGVPNTFSFDSTAKAKVVEVVQKARVELESAGLPNAAHSKADAYLDCALLLMEQDEPEADLVATLIKRALLIMAAIGLSADLKSIFWIKN